MAGIITYHRHNNYGAILQAYALQNTIIRLGFDAEIIDYKYRSRRFSLYTLLKKDVKPYILGVAGAIMRIPRFLSFRRFRNKLILSPKYNNRNIGRANERYTIFVSGSDNVWNADITGFDKNYFLDFVRDTSKRRSYASSFGSDRIPENLREEYRVLLEQYEKIGVREESGARIIEELTGRKAEVVLDPTFLLEKEQWEQLAVAPKEKNYMLVYQLVPSARMIKLAKKISKKRQLKVVYVSFPMGGFIKGKWKLSIGPEKWLGYIRNAELILTDSFHGCVFSIIFKKQFYVVLTQLSTRIENILKKLGIGDRIVETFEDCTDKIDYSREFDSRLSELTASSMEVLELCLK